MEFKQCRKCLFTKPYRAFYNDNSRLDGKRGICKACEKEQTDERETIRWEWNAHNKEPER